MNIYPDRQKIYKINPDFWDKKLENYFKSRDILVVSKYLRGGVTYRSLGKEFGLSPERVRQITVKVLRNISTIYQNKDVRRELSYIEYINDQSKDVVRYMRKVADEVAKMIEGQGYLIDKLVKLEEENNQLRKKMTETQPMTPSEQGKKGAFQRWGGKLKNIKTPIIYDDKIQGIFLEDIERTLTKEKFTQFMDWYKGKTGGIYQDKYYVKVNDFEAFKENYL